MRPIVKAVLAASLLWLCSCNDSGTTTPQQPGTTPTGTPTGTPTAPPPPSTNATFTEVEAILAANCNSCHTAPNASAGLDFTTYENVVHNPVLPTLVVPGQPLQSELVIHARDNSSISGADLATISDWIAAGAPNN
jgi:hypothetical protein